MASLLLSLPPVVAFLLLLVFLDSFKLVSLRAVLRSVVAGAAAAFAAWPLNVALMEAPGVSRPSFARYVAPVTEECLKALFVVLLIRGRRVGFLVDAGLHGFAVGAGFALVENVHYLRGLAGASPALWLVRGFGTAFLHGATTSSFAIASKSLSDGHPSRTSVVFLPGLLLAIAVHSFFNHFVLQPVLATLLLLTLLPLLMILVFERSQRATHAWLQADFDTDALLLGTILSGQAGETRVGEYLRSLKVRFPAVVVADMLCLIRVHLELSLRGKGLLMAREAGFAPPVGADVRASLEELRYLEKAIGPTGLLAIRPLLKTSRRDIWQLFKLKEAGSAGAAR